MRQVEKFPIICIAGRMRSGKNTLANILTRDYRYEQFAFADALREIMLVTDPIVSWNEDQSYPVRYSELIRTIGYERAKDEYPEVRRLLKQLGTEGVRHIIGENTWVNTCFKRVRAHQGPSVITDCRFLSEEYAAQLHGALVVLVKRPQSEDLSDTHASEVEMDQMEPDVIVWNDLDGFNFLESRVKDLHNLAVAKMKSLSC